MFLRKIYVEKVCLTGASSRFKIRFNENYMYLASIQNVILLQISYNDRCQVKQILFLTIVKSSSPNSSLMSFDTLFILKLCLYRNFVFLKPVIKIWQ